MSSILSQVSLLSDAKFLEEKSSQFTELKENLDHKNMKKRLNAMKRLIAMMTIGRDVSQFFPDVVKNVIVDNTEIKKLVYMFLTHYAEENQQLALLAINSLQQDLKSSNQRVRANALRAMSSIHIKVVIPIVMIALKNAVRDTSSYVRKAAACAIPKVFRTDTGRKAELVDMIAELLSNAEPNVLGASVFAFSTVCPDRIDLLHPHFRKICHLLADFDYFGQTITLKVLTRYARTQFLSPLKHGDEEENVEDAPFYDSDEDEDEDNDDDSQSGKKGKKKAYVMDPDHRLLIRSATVLLNSADAAVITGVCSLMFSIAPLYETRQCAPAVARHLFNYREMQYVVLASVSTMAAKRPAMFRQYVKMFFIFWDDPDFVRELKLDILANLASDSTIGPILLELFSYVNHYDANFVHQAIRTIGRCAMKIPDVAERCLHMLLRLVSTSTEDVVAQAISVIRQLLQRDPQQHVAIIKRMAKLLFKVSIPMARTALVWIVGEYREMIPKIAPDCLRQLAKSFRDEAVEVKLQILNLAVKLYLSNPKQSSLLFKYVMDLSKNDVNFDIRDRARMIRALFFKKKSDDKKDEELKAKTKMIMKKCFLWVKPPPETESPFQQRENFTLGSLSHVVQHSVSGYESLPDFPEVPPDPKTREPPRSEYEERLEKKSRKLKKKYKNVDEFYKDSDSDDSDSDSDSDDSDSEDSDSDSGSDSDSEPDSDSDTDEAENTKGKMRGKNTDAEEDGDDDSDSSTDDSDEEDEAPKTKPAQKQKSQPVSNLLNLLDDDEDDSKNAAAAGFVGPDAGADKNILAGLTFEDNLITGSSVQQKPADSSKQFFQEPGINVPRRINRGVLLKESLGEGMEVRYSFMRQESIYSKKMAVVELEFVSRVEVRDIHMTNVKATGFEVRVFDRIPVLHANQTATAKFHVDFKGQERKLQFDISTTDRKYPVALAPTPGDLLQGCAISPEEYESSRRRLTGMQEAKFTSTKYSSAKDLASRIVSCAGVTPLGGSSKDTFKLAATPRDDPTQRVLVTIEKSGTGFTVTINCDDMLFLGRVEDHLKKLI